MGYFFNTAHNFSGVGDLCKQYGALFAVDTVASLGGVPLEADKLGIDAIYTGSQKVLSCPPGTAPISFSEKAVAKIKSRRYGLLQIKSIKNSKRNARHIDFKTSS